MSQKIENKQVKIKKLISSVLWLITIFSLIFFLYNVYIFSTKVSYYDFELDKEIKPSLSMVLSYSIGAFIGAAIIPLVFWGFYGVIYFFNSEKFEKIKLKWKSTIVQFYSSSQLKKDDVKIIAFIPKCIEKIKNLDTKIKNLIGVIWILFHLLMLSTSKYIFNYHLSWRNFWIFNEWDDYSSQYSSPHYDISEFTIYVIFQMTIIFGRKYLKGESLINSGSPDVNNKTSSIDEQINNLKKYKELFDLGVISESEFLEQKEKILNN